MNKSGWRTENKTGRKLIFKGTNCCGKKIVAFSNTFVVFERKFVRDTSKIEWRVFSIVLLSVIFKNRGKICSRQKIGDDKDCATQLGESANQKFGIVYNVVHVKVQEISETCKTEFFLQNNAENRKDRKKTKLLAKNLKTS